jgi:homospermidine synthase
MKDLINLKPNQKIVILGCGAVGKCCLYYLNQFIKYKPSQVTIIDKDPSCKNFPTVKKAIKNGINFLDLTIKRDNIEWLLDKKLKLSKYDLIIDLTTNTPTYLILKECRMRGLLYINTSIEEDYLDLNENNTCPINNGIFLQHLNLQVIAEKTKEYGNITSLVEFGMNPGLISVFVKQGIMNLAKKIVDYKSERNLSLQKNIKKYIKDKNHKKLSEILQIEVIHCSEIDTQIPKETYSDKFVNTWSCVGLITEGVEPAEIQLGTHENNIPFSKSSVSQIIPQLLITNKAGKDILFNSVVPLKINKDKEVEFIKFQGRCIHHGEGISLNRYLSSFKYSPTMHYVYKLNPLTEILLDTLSTKQLINISRDQEKWKVLNMYDDKLKGYDNIGSLFMLKKNPFTNENKPFYFWTGSICDTNYTKNVLKDNYFGPTIIQVMSGVLSGAKWILKNKNKGLCFGEDLDDDYIIKNCKKFLGVYYSDIVNNDIIINDSNTLDKLIVNKNTDITNIKDLN